MKNVAMPCPAISIVINDFKVQKEKSHNGPYTESQGTFSGEF